MGSGTLFDSISRYGGPALYSESQFAFLNRADGPQWRRVRELLEAWYADHPDPDGDLRARFREHDFDQHAPAWWELYTYTLFRRLGYTVTVHPEIPGATGRPDLLITRGDSAMYVECVVLFDDGSIRTSDSQAWTLDCIDSAKNPDFMVDIMITTRGSQRPKQREITQPIETWLASLDYDSIRAAQLAQAKLPSKIFEFRDWRIRLTALPVVPDRRGEDFGRIGIGPASGVFVVTSEQGIRKLLNKKAAQCQGVNHPLIVAVLNWSTFATQREMEGAAFGSKAVKYTVGERDSVQVVRETDGYWHPGPPPRGGRVSGVMFSEHLHVSQLLKELPTLWLNPWAHKPIHERLPFVTHSAHDTGEAHLAAEATTSPEAVFDLPSNWPDF